MDLRQIQYFLCLYEEKTVTRAARRLNIVQPALSMQIAKIEGDQSEASAFEQQIHRAQKLFQAMLGMV